MTSYASVAEAYDDYLWNKKIAEKAVRAEGIKGEVVHASELPYCMRAIVLGLLGQTEWDRKQLKGTLRIFENGTFFHLRMQSALKAAGVLVREEEFVHDDQFKVGGSIDGQLLLSDGVERLAEFKSMNSWGFSKSELPLPQHKMQASVYMYCTGIYVTRFVYENKDTQAISEMDYELDERMLEAAFRRSAEAWRWHGDILLPPMTCLFQSDSKARNCLARKGCFKHAD